MATQVQWRGGSTAEHSTFTGAAREVTVDTQKKTLVVHDGSTAGGEPLLREDQVNLPTSVTNGLSVPSTNNVAISTNSFQRLLIDASGNVNIDSNTLYVDATNNRVGLGTSSPSTLLHLSSATGTATPTPTELRIATTSNANDWSTTTPWGNISFYSADATTGPREHAGIAVITNSSTGGQSSLVFKTASSSSPSEERLRITSTGLVGIGTTSPANTLHVKGGNANTLLLDNGGEQYTMIDWHNNTVIRAQTYYDNTNHKFEHYVPTTNSAVFTWKQGTTERARIDSSGRLLVGTSSAPQSYDGASLTGLQIEKSGSTATRSLALVSNASSNFPAQLHFGRSRGTTNGAVTAVANGDDLGVITFGGADGTTAFIAAANIIAEVDGTPGANDMPGRLVFATTADGASSPTTRMTIESTGAIKLENGGSNLYRPGASGSGLGFSTNCTIPLNETGTSSDNTENLGAAGTRWATVYAGTGTINTSDANLKQDVDDLDAAELSVATAIKGLVKKYRFKDAVEAKGDDARIHVGVIAQEVEQAFVGAGLDPRRYALFCEDELEDGTKRLGIRYDELLAFVIAAL